jgi:uncharacterized protein YgbK (DUF1537 family)
MIDYFLADDLSGALDAAAAFHRAGRRVTIALSADDWPDESADDVVGFTTETRNASASDAAAKVAAVIASGRARGARLVYKKIDSTLRGQVAAELAALAAAMPEASFLFAPANPSVGRTVRDGRLLVHGVPVAETEFARDPVSPVRESSIRALLGNAGGLRVTIADTETEADLIAAVRRMESKRTPWVAIGSGALARPVAALGGQANASAASEWRRPAPGPMVFVCGSSHHGNRAQADQLARECGVPIREVKPGDVAGTTRAAVADAVKHGGVSLLLETERTESRRALEAITDVAREVVRETGVARIFVTGGETAFALGHAFQVSRLIFRAEIEPGLSLSSAETDLGLMLWAVKPGAFGDVRTWRRGHEALKSGYFI